MTPVLKCSPRTPFFYYYYSLVTPVSETKTYLGFGMAHFHTETAACGKTARVNLTNLVTQVSVWMSRFVIAFGDPLLRVLCIWMGYGQSVDWPASLWPRVLKFHCVCVCVKNTRSCLMVQLVASLGVKERCKQHQSKTLCSFDSNLSLSDLTCESRNKKITNLQTDLHNGLHVLRSHMLVRVVLLYTHKKGLWWAKTREIRTY